ncbi:MAG: B12-binding domain-containing radical SAM protein [Rubrivivax sp.]|nr:B12-binding domain-containing radical SAM protein [Pyrinomonadaceae bacterium]
MRITFVHTPDSFLAETQQYGAMFMPVWAYTLAAYVEEPEGYDLRLLDMRFDDVKEASAADLFVFSGVNQDYDTIVSTCASLRERHPDSTFVIGGPITWSLNQAGEVSKLEMFDHIFIGDGEEAFPRFLKLFRERAALPKVFETRDRFDVSKARGFHRPFLDATFSRYYGGVLEVSRGCPFLCEFCDIRVLPDNNRPHSFSPQHIVSELDHMARLGIRQVLFAADNFIGDLRWAEDVLDEIIEWQERTGQRVALYTWLTINLSRHPQLLQKLRRANFDMLFIGVESFSNNSLMETAKVQNTAGDMIAALREIQSYGFAVVAGLIFGFDSDAPESFDLTLEGMSKAGLISGDPSLLTALPGTPLFRRMKLSGRLRNNKNSLGGYKYCTNIRYLMPRDQMIAGYQSFVRRFCKGHYQYERLKGFLDNLDRGNYIPLQSQGYGSLGKYVSMVFKSPGAVKMLAQRLFRVGARPAVLWHALRGLLLMLSRSRRHARLFGVFQFWLFNWTNAMLKYEGLSDADFDIESVPEGFDRSLILPEHYMDMADEEIPQAKIDAQQRSTVGQLRRLAAMK